MGAVNPDLMRAAGSRVQFKPTHASHVSKQTPVRDGRLAPGAHVHTPPQPAGLLAQRRVDRAVITGRSPVHDCPVRLARPARGKLGLRGYQCRVAQGNY